MSYQTVRMADQNRELVAALELAATWAKQVSEQPANRVYPGIANAAKAIHAQASTVLTKVGVLTA